jgi:tRNA pseudouridine55 synthase
LSVLHGWIVLDKPHGLGSTQAVGAVKRALREGAYAKTKIGHGGTLDPLATGVLPIALGEATKLAGRMLDADKGYDFTVNFGAETDTLDLEGKVIATSDHRPTLADIKAILPRFIGQIEQVPPAFSAIKIDGDRAYDLARKGDDVDMKSRKVEVHSLSAFLPSCAASFSCPIGRQEGRKDEVTVSALVSKGTYIRALARDLARALGTVGHVTMLRRTRAAPFDLAQAISLDKLFETARARGLENVILPLKTALVDIPALALTPEQARLVRNGQVLTGIAAPDGLHFAELAETPVALVKLQSGTLTVERGFNL